MYEDEIKEIKEDLAKINKVTYEYENYLKAKAIRVRDYIIAALLVLLIVSNLIWAIYESKMETVTETTETITTFEGVEQNANDGVTNSIVGGDYYGDTKD